MAAHDNLSANQFSFGDRAYHVTAPQDRDGFHPLVQVVDHGEDYTTVTPSKHQVGSPGYNKESFAVSASELKRL